jgi:CHAT domain-containing protein
MQMVDNAADMNEALSRSSWVHIASHGTHSVIVIRDSGVESTARDVFYRCDNLKAIVKKVAQLTPGV